MVLNYQRFRQQLKFITLIALCAAMASCASFGSKTNAERMAKLSGADFVISIAPTTLEYSRISEQKSTGTAVYQLINETNLVIADPSSAILNSLNKYFQKKYQLRFIAKGKVNNLDPAFIQRALKKGDYLIDVRVDQLSLNPTTSNQFYLSASYLFTVIDRHKGKAVIKDRCSFAEPQRPQPLDAFAAQQGREIANALQRHATQCLRYFAQGSPIVEKQPATVAVGQNRSDTINTEVLLSSHISHYPQYTNTALTTASSSLGLRWQQFQGSHWSRNASIQGLFASNITSDLNLETGIGGARVGFGFAFHPKANERYGFTIRLLGQTANYRPNAWRLSTNAVALELGTFGKLLGPVQIGIQYAAIQHIGATRPANELGHQVGIDLSLRLNGSN